MTTYPNIYTIGVYGTDAERFFHTLEDAQIDTFCDLRARRGVRGSEYVFANSARLQAALAERGIRYLHFPQLAPSDAIRKAQYAADSAEHIGKRQRTHLAPAFVEGYRESVLNSFDSRAFLDSLGPEVRRVVLMCVEREPSACHRSLLANRLQDDLGVEVTHLLP